MDLQPMGKRTASFLKTYNEKSCFHLQREGKRECEDSNICSKRRVVTKGCA